MTTLIARVVPEPRRRQVAIGLIAAVVAGFIFFSPITYGWTLSPLQLHNHIWLPNWR
jgi:dolichyl-phosphate-mannose--protein O-mannosyl transferase